jgi:hypothetical protein
VTVVIGQIAASDAAAIEALLSDGAWLIDHGQADRLPATLAPNATVHGLGPDVLDRAGFTAWANARAENRSRRTRHAISNIRLTAIEDGRVRATTLVVIWVAELGDPPRLSFLGDWVDVLVRHDTRWLIAERHLIPMGGEPATS